MVFGMLLLGIWILALMIGLMCSYSVISLIDLIFNNFSGRAITIRRNIIMAQSPEKSLIIYLLR